MTNNIANNKQLFFRVEHSFEYLPFLLQYTKENKKIGCGPWSYVDRFTNEEVEIVYNSTKDHALPYPPEAGMTYPFDSEIHEIVKGDPTIYSNGVKANFIFGCTERRAVNKYFSYYCRKVLDSYGFELKIYSSEYVYQSQYQAVMDISKPYHLINASALV